MAGQKKAKTKEQQTEKCVMPMMMTTVVDLIK